MGPVKDRRKTVETDTNLSAWGTSRAVRIPKNMCEKTGIGIGSKLRVTAGEDPDGPYILVRPMENHRSYGDAPFASMEEIFAGYKGEYQPTEFDWGQDVGAEVIK